MLVFIVRGLLGLNGSTSSRSLKANVSGLEFMIVSTSHSRVLKDSSSRREPCSCSRTVSNLRVVRICRSHMPPMRLPLGELKIQSVPCNLLLICSFSISSTACNSVLAPKKMFNCCCESLGQVHDEQ